uniref:Uncharacterized protein n=1 Tax=viral metagenome TaxID=1070528 RepID=A0A6C0I4N2_9ZZZZ
MSATYLEVTQDYGKYSGKRNGDVYLKKGEIVFAKTYSPIIDDTYIHSFILNKNFFVPKAIIKPVQLTDTHATMLSDLEAAAEAKAAADADADADAKAYAEYARRARQNVSEWLLKQAGGKKKRTKRNKRVKSRRRIKGKSVRRRK